MSAGKRNREREREGERRERAAMNEAGEGSGGGGVVGKKEREGSFFGIVPTIYGTSLSLLLAVAARCLVAESLPRCRGSLSLSLFLSLAGLLPRVSPMLVLVATASCYRPVV